MQHKYSSGLGFGDGREVEKCTSLKVQQVTVWMIDRIDRRNEMKMSFSRTLICAAGGESDVRAAGVKVRLEVWWTSDRGEERKPEVSKLWNGPKAIQWGSHAHGRKERQRDQRVKSRYKKKHTHTPSLDGLICLWDGFVWISAFLRVLAQLSEFMHWCMHEWICLT